MSRNGYAETRKVVEQIKAELFDLNWPSVYDNITYYYYLFHLKEEKKWI